MTNWDPRVIDGEHNIADRMYAGMKAAWKATEKKPLTQIGFRSVPLRLEPRGGAGFSVEGLTK